MLALGFFLIALIYASVGFGGGTSYLALLSSSGMNFELIPKVALICNIIVVTNNVYQFHQNKLIPFKVLKPFLLSSLPCSLIGGLYPISEKIFILLLVISLLIAGVRLLFVSTVYSSEKIFPRWLILLVGAGIGLISGLIGIGGGIFLSPFLLNFSLAKPKEVAASASFFILCNSLTGLLGQFLKSPTYDFYQTWPFLVSVFLGGLVGVKVCLHPKITQVLVQRLTAVLVIFISVKLIWDKQLLFF